MEKSVEFTVEIGSDSSDDFTAKQFPVDQTAVENIEILTFLEQDIASERSNRHPLVADISDGVLSFVNRITNQIPAAQNSNVGKTAIQYQVAPAGASEGSDCHPPAADISNGGLLFVSRITNQILAAQTSDESDEGKTAKQYQGKQINTKEQNIASERSNRHPLAADISDGGLSFVNRITNQIPAVQKSDAGKTTIQYQVTPACQISENEILQKNILRVVSIRQSLAQIINRPNRTEQTELFF
ncbi:hypothetical protein quinque_001462 [Culex quinquefasciatus]